MQEVSSTTSELNVNDIKLTEQWLHSQTSKKGGSPPPQNKIIEMGYVKKWKM